MAACVVALFIMMFKAKNEINKPPLHLRFFGLQIVFPKYLTEKGKIYRRRYWQYFLLGLLFSMLTVGAMYFLTPELRYELGNVTALLSV
jgi:hypothetical protein